MHVEHELRERALEPRERALEHHEARAGQLGRGLEVHLPQSFTEIEMLLRRESVIALGAETMVLDVIGCLLAVRHVLERQVGDLRKRVLELLRELLLLCLERGDFGFQACDLGNERLRRRLLIAFFRRADLTRSDIAARECRFHFLNGSAPALIDGKELVRMRRQTAAHQSAIEFLLMVANPLDVVHGFCRHAARRRASQPVA